MKDKSIIWEFTGRSIIETSSKYEIAFFGDEPQDVLNGKRAALCVNALSVISDDDISSVSFRESISRWKSLHANIITKCNCGRPLRYSHFKDGVEVMSCNKYAVCPTYDELLERLKLDRIVECHDCGCDATNDRYDNGDSKIRCGECSIKRYKKDHPFEVCIKQYSIVSFKVNS